MGPPAALARRRMALAVPDIWPRTLSSSVASASNKNFAAAHISFALIVLFEHRDASSPAKDNRKADMHSTMAVMYNPDLKDVFLPTDCSTADLMLRTSSSRFNPFLPPA